MRMLFLSVLALCACGENDEGPVGTLTKDETTMLFVTANRELHTLHEMAFLGGATPQFPYTYNCPSGTIEMTGELDGSGAAKTLLHVFKTCVVGGLTLEGTLDYTHMTTGCPDDKGFAFDIVGEPRVTAPIEGFCRVDVHEDCRQFSGRACGFPAQDISTGL